MTDRVLTPAAVQELKDQLLQAQTRLIDALVAGLEVLADPPAPEPEPEDRDRVPSDPKYSPGAGSVTLSWDRPAAGDPVNYLYGRDGVDAGGAGPWSGTLPPFARTVTLDKLVPGVEYTVTLGSVWPDGSTDLVSSKITLPVPAEPTIPVPTTPAPGAGVSTSGAFVRHSRPDAEAFLKWRGGTAPANVCAFTSRRSESEVMAPWWQTSVPKGARLSLRVPLVPEDDRDLSKRRDTMWKTVARQASEVDEHAYIAPGWEMNLPGWAWAVTPANLEAWRAAWVRAYDTMKSVNPGLLIGFNGNGGGDQTGVPIKNAIVAGKVDWVGPDQYDCWPGFRTEAEIAIMWNQYGGLTWWATLARSLGTRLALPEWGCSIGAQWAGHTGGDNPRYIQEIAKYRRMYSGIWLFDSYFNETDGYLRSDIWVPGGKTPSCPKAGEAYRQLFGG